METATVSHVCQHPVTVAVVIPTKNRSYQLQDAVRSVFRQTVLPSQIVVVDQSRDATGRRLVEEALAAAPQEVRQTVTLDYVLDSTIPGLTWARNLGKERVSGADIMLFMDDDEDLEPNYIEEILVAYRRLPDAAGIAGVVVNYPLPPAAFRIWSIIFARGPFRDERQPIYWHAERLRQHKPIAVAKLGGGLMSLKTAVARSAHFDTRLRGYALAEDVDFSCRIQPAHLYIAPAARLRHNHRHSSRDGMHWLRGHAQAQYYLYEAHWRHDFKNRVRFAWLNCGYALAASLASLKRVSLEPWRALFDGVSEARRIGEAGDMPPTADNQSHNELAS